MRAGCADKIEADSQARTLPHDTSHARHQHLHCSIPPQWKTILKLRLNSFAGVLPLKQNVAGPGIEDPEMPEGVHTPQYISDYRRPSHNNKLNGIL